eukprot:jgi/Botrbrau1/3681/Bobra.0008s0010.1
MDDQEVGLPRATILKMMKDAAPAELRLANDAVSLIGLCCNEFVQLISSEATELCEKENKHVLQPEHVLRALDTLGFSAMLPEVQRALEGWQDSNKGVQRIGKRKTKAEEAGLSEAEQIALQQKLFAEARASSTFAEL